MGRVGLNGYVGDQSLAKCRQPGYQKVYPLNKPEFPLI